MAYKFGTPSSPTGTVTDVAGTQSTDASTGIVFSVTLNTTGTNTLENPTNVQEGQEYTWMLVQDAVTPVDVTFGTNFLFAGGTTPTITQVAGAVDIVRATALDDGAGNIKLYSAFDANVKAIPSFSDTYSYEAVGNVAAQILTFDPADTSAVPVSSGTLYDIWEYTNAFSFSAWVKTSWSGAGNGYFAGRYSFDTPGSGIGFGVAGNVYGPAGSGQPGRLLIYYRSSASQTHYLYTGTNIADGSWHHVAYTYDGSGGPSGWTLYIDGSAAAMATHTGDTINSGTCKQGNTPFALGFLRGDVGTIYTDNMYGGFIDEAAVWDVELSSSEVSAIYNSGVPDDLNNHTQAANLVSWWRLGDAPSDNLTGTNPATNLSVNVIEDVSAASGYSRSDGTAIGRTASSGQADFVVDVP